MSKIMIVEDDEIFAGILAKNLRKRGFEAKVINDLHAAKAEIREFEPDTVLLDVNVKGDNGLNLIPIVRAHNASARIVVLTSFGVPRTAAWAIRNGASEYLSKPADIDEIVYAIEGKEGAIESVPASFMSPDEARDAHILQFFDQNDCNVSQTARALGMHRRTLQRILDRLRSFARSRESTKFGRLRRQFDLWSRWLNQPRPQDQSENGTRPDEINSLKAQSASASGA